MVERSILENDVERVNDTRDPSELVNSLAKILVYEPPMGYCARIGQGKALTIVNRMLMRKSAPQPRSRKTPRGGRMKAKMILQMSL